MSSKFGQNVGEIPSKCCQFLKELVKCCQHIIKKSGVVNFHVQTTTICKNFNSLQTEYWQNVVKILAKSYQNVVHFANILVILFTHYFEK